MRNNGTYSRAFVCSYEILLRNSHSSRDPVTKRGRLHEHGGIQPLGKIEHYDLLIVRSAA